MEFCGSGWSCWMAWFSSPASAAWFQAASALIAIAVAIAVPVRQHRLDVERDNRRAVAQEQSMLAAIVIHLKSAEVAFSDEPETIFDVETASRIAAARARLLETKIGLSGIPLYTISCPALVRRLSQVQVELAESTFWLERAVYSNPEEAGLLEDVILQSNSLEWSKIQMIRLREAIEAALETMRMHIASLATAAASADS